MDVQIELNETEISVLGDLLDQAYRDLKEEIYKTETDAYKDALKEREAILLGLLKKVGRSLSSAETAA